MVGLYLVSMALAPDSLAHVATPPVPQYKLISLQHTCISAVSLVAATQRKSASISVLRASIQIGSLKVTHAVVI